MTSFIGYIIAAKRKLYIFAHMRVSRQNTTVLEQF
jgi:hypothetical protein